MAHSNDPTPEDFARIEACRRRYLLCCRGMPAWIAANGAVEALHWIAGPLPADFKHEVAKALRAMADHLEGCAGPGQCEEEEAPAAALTPDGPPPGTKLC